ncbi:MAG: hydantoinase B/oxoprolinase family protein [Phycisphaerales bacterium]|nr:hydantoinase B/oxoprolinase family protein [Phycisphaerales bacterium]
MTTLAKNRPTKSWRSAGVATSHALANDAATFTILSDRDRAGPWGLFGGLPGRKAFYVLNPDREARQLSSKCVVQLKPGDTVSFQTPGGGGYGPADQREPERVLKDARDGKVSVERARDIYRVEIDPVGWRINKMATKRLRADARSRP